MRTPYAGSGTAHAGTARALQPYTRPEATPPGALPSHIRTYATRADALRAVFRRAILGAGAAVGVAALHAWHDPGVICPLRRFTGVPCPVCGSTTLFTDLGGGHPWAALAANPVTAVAALGLLLAPLGPGRRWWALRPRTRGAVLAVAAAVSWAWQLHRFGYLQLGM